MFEDYKNIIRRFHQALLRKDLKTLRRILSDSAKKNLKEEFHTFEQMDLPLSDNIIITGISLEGSGKVITVHYVNRLVDREYPMDAYLLRVGDTIKLNHLLPQLKKVE